MMKYELLVTAETWDEAVIGFNEAFDDDENYTEAYDLHQYDDDTWGVFFTAENPIDTDDEPLVLEVEDELSPRRVV